MRFAVLLFLLSSVCFAAQKVEVINSPSQVGSRTYVHQTFKNLSTSTVLYSVPAGKTFYLVNLGISILNGSTTVHADIDITDTSGSVVTTKIPFTIGDGTNQSNGYLFYSTSYLEPIRFSSEIGASLISGTVQMSGFFTGYTE